MPRPWTSLDASQPLASVNDVEEKHAIKERSTPVWCDQCKRRPTWSSSGICYRCSHRLPERDDRPRPRAVDRFESFAVVGPWSATARFAAAVVSAELIVLAIMAAGAQITSGSMSLHGIRGLLFIVVINGAAATLGFLLAFRMSEPFYLPMRRTLNRVAWMAGAATAVLSLSGCCMAASPGAWLACMVVGGLASGGFLEAAHKRAIRSIVQGQACLSCGHLLYGSTLSVCPECGGPLLRPAGGPTVS